MGLPMRRSELGVVVAVLAATLSIAGCGSATEPAATAHGGGQRGSGSAPHAGSASKAQAQAYVKAVNLRAGDLPGFTGSASKEHQSATQKRLSAGMKRCLGEQAAGAAGVSAEAGKGKAKARHATLAEGGSEEYERKGAGGIAFAESEVSVAPSAAAATFELAALRSGRVRYCMQRYLTGLLAHERHGHHGVRMGAVSVGRLTPPAPGATGGFGWKLTVPLRTHGLTVALRMEILGFVDGPAQVTLTTGALPVPFPGSAERSLYTLLLHRAESHRV